MKRVKRLAAAAMQDCTGAGTAYAQCISTHLNDIKKDTCASEFQSFKACVQQVVRSSTSLFHHYR